jgi:hypothetical protein
MKLLLMHAYTFEALWVRQPLASLLRPGGQPTGAFVLSGHTDRKDLCGFLASRHPAQRRQATRDARRLLRLAHPVLLGHTEQRFDRIRTDRHSDVIETSGLGGLTLVRKRGGKL